MTTRLRKKMVRRQGTERMVDGGTSIFNERSALPYTVYLIASVTSKDGRNLTSSLSRGMGEKQ